jgi:hypothetical protein
VDWRDPTAPHDLALQTFRAEQERKRQVLLVALFTAIDQHEWYEVVQLRGRLQEIDDLTLSLIQYGSDERAEQQHRLLSTGH